MSKIIDLTEMVLDNLCYVDPRSLHHIKDIYNENQKIPCGRCDNCFHDNDKLARVLLLYFNEPNVQFKLNDKLLPNMRVMPSMELQRTIINEINNL